MITRKLIPLIILSILTLPILWSLFRPGFFVSDDGEWMVIRFSAFHQALADGQFPVRFLGRLNHEYGYPVANFLYPGFMYLAEPIHLLGFGFVDSIKILLWFSMLGSAIFTYLWLAKFFGKWGSLVGSLFYLYAPYHLFDLYKRGSVGEVLALAIVPFILWQIERKSIFWSTLGIGFLVISHNSLALLFLPVIILYMLLDIFTTKNRIKLTYWYIGILVLSFGLSAFFWIPAFFELKYTVFNQTTVSSYKEYFAGTQLIGTLTYIIFLFTLSLFIIRKINIRRHRLTLLLFIVGFGSLTLSTSIGSPFWNFLPVSFVQFPFRLLSLTILCASFLAASVLSVFSGRVKIVAGAAIVMLVIFSAGQFMNPSQFINKGEGFYATNEGTTTVQNEYLPRWVKNIPTNRPKEKIEIIGGKGEIKNQFSNSRKISADLELQNNAIIQVNVNYFPGWQAWVNGQKVEIDYKNEKGVIQIFLPKGKYQILVKFGETPLRLFSDIISLGSLLFLGVLTLRKHVFLKNFK